LIAFGHLLERVQPMLSNAWIFFIAISTLRNLFFSSSQHIAAFKCKDCIGNAPAVMEETSKKDEQQQSRQRLKWRRNEMQRRS
jgi:hypothetical protein